MDISFVIPAKNEEDSVAELHKEITSIMKGLVSKGKKRKLSYEIIFIDDGSTDETYKKIKSLHRRDKRVRALKHRGNFGKSAALQSGFQFSKGKIVFTLDADLQDDPREIPRFLNEIYKGFDLVSGWKKRRYDPLSKKVPSRIFNYAVTKLTGVAVHDTNCGYKAYKREVVENLNLYGEQYRFIPVLAAKQNFLYTEIVVNHRARKYGKTKFGWERNIKGFLDLLTIVFLTGYLKRPGHFFGFFGLCSFSLGFLIGCYIAYLRFTTGTIQDRHPLLFLGMLLMIVGVQLFTTGLISELMVNFLNRDNPDKRITNTL